jgi:hypothetical protein
MKITDSEIEEEAYACAQETMRQMYGDTYSGSEDCSDLFEGFIAGAKWALKRTKHEIEEPNSDEPDTTESNKFDKTRITLNW